MKLSSKTLIAALVVYGTGGFFAGRISSADGTRPGALGIHDGVNEECRSTNARTRSESGRAGSTTVTRQGIREDRNARLERIVRGEDPLLRNRALVKWIDQLVPDELQDALDHFRSLGITESRSGEYALLLTAWAKEDPAAALEWINAGGGDGFATKTILSSWAAVDPVSALEWAEANHSGNGVNPHIAGVIRGIVSSDPGQATELLVAMPPGDERGEALDAIVPHFLGTGAESARAWISAIQDESLRNDAILCAAKGLAVSDPLGTVQWLLDNPGETSSRCMDDVFGVWVKNDPDAALAAMASMSPSEARSSAFSGLVSSMAGSDPQRALDLMDDNFSEVNDDVVSDFIWSSFRSSPATAIAEIPRIADEDERDQVYRNTLERWMESDKNAASNWIKANDAPAEIVESLGRRGRYQ